MFRAILLPAEEPDCHALLVVDADRCLTLGPPLLHLPVVESDLDEVLACHGWARRGPWWLNGKAPCCEVAPVDAGASTDV